MAKVLVVDDDPDILTLVQTWLKRGGHKVAVTSSGPEALAMVEEKGRPDVCVVDVSMPEMSGLELVKILHERPETKDVPVIFLSARVLPEDIEEGKKLGNVYLTKPFIGKALLDAVEKLAQDNGEW
jgi:CheY-like chemotaxis protein